MQVVVMCPSSKVEEHKKVKQIIFSTKFCLGDYLNRLLAYSSVEFYFLSIQTPISKNLTSVFSFHQTYHKILKIQPYIHMPTVH